MPSLKIAHMNRSGQDMIIVPLESSFGNKSTPEQNGIKAEIQKVAKGAGLAGIVVPVWESSGRFYFIAPNPWHPFFKSIDLRYVWANLNRELSW